MWKNFLNNECNAKISPAKIHKTAKNISLTYDVNDLVYAKSKLVISPVKIRNIRNLTGLMYYPSNSV